MLQCTSIYRCALFMRAKKNIYYFIEFLSHFPLKKYFLFLSFHSLSGFSSFFLFPSLFFSPSSTLCCPCLSTQSVAPLYSVLTLRFCLLPPTKPLPNADRSPSPAPTTLCVIHNSTPSLFAISCPAPTWVSILHFLSLGLHL